MAGGARAPSAACLLEARLEVDVALPRRLGPVELGPRHRELSWGYGDWLRCSDSSRSPHAPARSVPPWQGLVGLLAACAGRARRAERGVGGGGGCQMRLPNPPARSPLQVRVPPEGCPVAGRPGAGAVRLPRQAPKKSGYSKGEQLGRCLPKYFSQPAHSYSRDIELLWQRGRAQRHVGGAEAINLLPHEEARRGARQRGGGAAGRHSLPKQPRPTRRAASPPRRRPHAGCPHTAARGGRAGGLPQLGTRAPR